jgi:CheY-like chemotaxis protein
MIRRQVEVLMAEDSPSDRAIALEAAKKARTLNRLHLVTDGEEAISFLRKEGEFSQAPTPDLILLDLNMPRKSGLEVLAEIKGNPVWRNIPVIVLTSSGAKADISKAYLLQANSYIKKPVDFDRFSEVVRMIDNFWFSVAQLPAKPR